MIDITYDPKADAAYITLSTARILESKEVTPDIILDYAEDGRIVGIEILRQQGAGARRLTEGAATG